MAENLHWPRRGQCKIPTSRSERFIRTLAEANAHNALCAELKYSTAEVSSEVEQMLSSANAAWAKVGLQVFLVCANVE